MPRQHSYMTACRHQHGSVLLLVVVTLVLMALLGMAYLQVARVDRIATRQPAQINIQIVANATVAYIAEVLGRDVVDVNGNFFNAAAGVGIESYDFPYTNPAITFPVVDNDGAPLGNAVGGELDDTWLSSLLPAFQDLQNPTWAHLTNLSGVFLRLPALDPDDSAIPVQPEEHAVDNDSAAADAFLRRDTSVLITSNPTNTQALDQTADARYDVLGVDTDGDGVPDARWTWAPIRQIAGVRYVMAVRIIDNSALLPLNVATALTSDGGSNLAASPRGYTPTSIDLSRLLARANAAGTPWASELATDVGGNSLFNLRGLSTSLPTPLGLDAANFSNYPGTAPASYTPLTSRLGAWLDRVSLYGDPTGKLNISNELELRYGFGLNNSLIDSDAENLMPSLLRRTASEPTYKDVDYSYLATIATDDEKMLAFYHGVDPSVAVAPGSPVALRRFPEVRKFLTTRSGAAIYAPNHGDIYGGARVLRYDLLTQDTGNADARLGNIFDRLFAIFSLGAPTYLNLSPAELEEVAAEFALAIHDYSDGDVTPSPGYVDGGIGTLKRGVNPSGATYFGMETLPFLRQIYLQGGYQDTDLQDAGGLYPEDAGYAGPDGNFDTWVFVAGSQALAVEIGNPFDRPIVFDALASGGPEVRIRISTGGGDWTYPLKGTIDSRGKFTVIRNAETPIDESGVGANLHADLQFTWSEVADAALTSSTALDQQVVDATAATAAPDFAVTGGWLGNSETPVTVELQVKYDDDPANPDQWVTYDRFTDGTLSLPQRRPYSADIVDDGQAHEQTSAARDGNGLRYLSNQGRGPVTGRQLAANGATPGYQTRVAHDLESDTKGGITGNVSLDTFQLPAANRPIMNVAELGWIFMFGFTNEPTGDFPTRFDAMALERQFLTPSDVPDTVGIPHASLIFDHFTTLSPRDDGMDNDNDTVADNEQEQFVPGLINLNTVPDFLAALAAPLPEDLGDVEALMNAVIAYRDDPSTRPAMPNLRNAPGIASIGELLLVNPTLAGGATPADMLYYTDPAAPAVPAEADLYPLPEDAAATRYSDRFPSEAAMARFQFLSQVFTTRSDIFTAYVVIRGYPAGDFRLGPVESARFFVVFDRSGLVTGSEPVKVLGVYQIN